MSRKSFYVPFVAAMMVALMLGAAPEGKKTPLHHEMEKMDTGMKKLRKSLRAPEGTADSLQAISAIEEAAINCKSMTPVKAETLPEAQRQEFVANYRKKMIGLIGIMLDVENALLAGDKAKAQELYKKLGELEEEGHEKFTPDAPK